MKWFEIQIPVRVKVEGDNIGARALKVRTLVGDSTTVDDAVEVFSKALEEKLDTMVLGDDT